MTVSDEEKAICREMGWLIGSDLRIALVRAQRQSGVSAQGVLRTVDLFKSMWDRPKRDRPKNEFAEMLPVVDKLLVGLSEFRSRANEKGRRETWNAYEAQKLAKAINALYKLRRSVRPLMALKRLGA